MLSAVRDSPSELTIAVYNKGSNVLYHTLRRNSMHVVLPWDTKTKSTTVIVKAIAIAS